ncbi:MAG TPA: bifunctional precorrin-2 dehydrogenase/sirohydrochlorin ferrochelatase, partial [Asticcacaulis sp.]
MLALPLSWPLKNKRVALIGDGAWLTRKLTLLRRTPAELRVYAPFGHAASSAGETVEQRWPDAADLADAALIVVAFADRDLAERGAALARQTRAPLNVVDYPDLSDFHFPAIIDRGTLSIGVASGGTAPVLAREARRRIEAAVPPSETHVAAFAEALSAPLRERFGDVDDRRRVWEQVLASPAAETARSGRIGEAVEQALRAVDAREPRK